MTTEVVDATAQLAEPGDDLHGELALLRRRPDGWPANSPT
jgi:hypothetical protein